MRAEFVNPFLIAATEVLESELGTEPARGAVALRKSARTTEHVTALVRVHGAIAGYVLYSMDDQTARSIVAHLQGAPCEQLDELAQSGIGELGNVITGRAATLLAEAGFSSVLAPPQLIVGEGTLISPVDERRLVIPLESVAGAIEIEVVLAEAAASNRPVTGTDRRN
jgi:chemotaxis protein CheX